VTWKVDAACRSFTELYLVAAGGDQRLNGLSQPGSRRGIANAKRFRLL